jgi:hypothetical protein
MGQHGVTTRLLHGTLKERDSFMALEQTSCLSSFFRRRHHDRHRHHHHPHIAVETIGETLDCACCVREISLQMQSFPRL